MITGLNHIGLCVFSIDETMSILSKAFGAKELARKAIPEIGQTSAIVEIGDFMLELMEPIGEAGVVPKFLAKNGQGLHHISLLTDDLDAECKHFADEKIKVIGDPANPIRMVFTHPKSTCGVICEVTDKPFDKNKPE